MRNAVTTPGAAANGASTNARPAIASYVRQQSAPVLHTCYVDDGFLWYSRQVNNHLND